jgi:hypothetical protein
MDKTKEILIKKLLKEGKITKDDAIVLEREEKGIEFLTPNTPNKFLNPEPIITPKPYKQSSWIEKELDRRANIAQTCGCNPANGGSGVCGCTLTGPLITC